MRRRGQFVVVRWRSVTERRNTDKGEVAGWLCSTLRLRIAHLGESLVGSLSGPCALLRRGLPQQGVRRPRHLLQGVLEVRKGVHRALLLHLRLPARRPTRAGPARRFRQCRVLFASDKLEPS